MPLQKKSNLKTNFVIVGQGLAGSVLALTLARAGYSVAVINNPNLSCSSQIAAGIWNPIVFKRLTKSWLADILIPELIQFYNYWEKEFNVTLLRHRDIIKPFVEDQEKKLWLKKASDSESRNIFLDQHIYSNFQLDNSVSISSYSKVMHAGNLDIPAFLECTKKFLLTHQYYCEEVFDYGNLHVISGKIQYKDIDADHIVFCEGHYIANNPYFKEIPMKPAKGETLIIRSTEIKLDQDIFNKGFFIMPLGNQLFKVGATYEWNQLNDIPTIQGKEYLIKKLDATLNSSYEIISHTAGVRPSVIDRRPIIGNHPQSKHLFVFNGLGTKGVMLAPHFANELVNAIKNGTEIHSEANVKRFYKTP